MALLLPPFIKTLDFKSKEELQLMPQTEEEHLENKSMDEDDQEKVNPDAEVRYLSLFVCVLLYKNSFLSLILLMLPHADAITVCKELTKKADGQSAHEGCCQGRQIAQNNIFVTRFFLDVLYLFFFTFILIYFVFSFY